MIKWLIFSLVQIPVLFYLPWVWFAWCNSPLDRDGPIWIVIAALALVLNYRNLLKAPKKTDYFALILIFFSIIFLFIGYKLDINFFGLSAALLLSVSCAGLLFGWTVFLIILPVYFIIFLSLPTSSYIIGYLLSQLNIRLMINVVYIKAFAAAFFFFVGWWYNRQSQYYLTRKNGVYWGSFCFFVVLMFFYYSPSTESPPFILNTGIDPLQGWYGEKSQLEGVEKSLYKKGNADKYYFYHENGDTITLINFKVNDNIHEIHPPDYCLRGAGWTILKDDLATLNLNGKIYLVRKVTASINNHRIILLSWYSSREESTHDFKAFRRKYKGTIDSEWNAYHVSIPFADNQNKAEDSLKKFISSKIVSE